MEIPFLTSGESKVYCALIELGESSIGNILKNSKVSHSKIYDILKRLSEKGLVSSVNKENKQFFSASEPKMLSELIHNKKNELKDSEEKIIGIIKTLSSRKGICPSSNIVSSFEGISGMKTVLESVLNNLKKGDEILILGSPKKVGENVGGYLKEWQKNRIKIKAKCLLLTDTDSPSWEEKWWEKSKKEKLTKTKKSKKQSPTYLIITDKSVVTIYFSKKIISIIINQKDIAERYKQFFKDFWKDS